MTNGTLEMAGRLDVLGDATLLIDGVDLTFEATTYSNLGIFTPDGSTSNVCMTNSTLTLSATNQKAYGIAMQGSGHFYAKGCTIAASSESATAHGVYVSSGTVEIESSEVIGTSGAKSYGLYNLGGTCLLTASDVTSTTTGTSTNSLGVCINNNGLFAPVFLRDGCTVTAYAPNSSKNYDYGVYDGAYGWIAFTKDCEATTSIFDYNMSTHASVTVSITRDSDGNLFSFFVSVSNCVFSC